MKNSIASIVSPGRRAVFWLAAAFVWAMSGAAFAQALVDISSTPLFAGRQPHPNVAVTMSVEYPSVGGAYKNDIAYLPGSVYLGYFDATRCYQYSDSFGGYFFPSGSADVNHECSDAFSGNFMNWTTMSAIDEFRYAITGGNRDVENGPNNGTIIQRAYLPDGCRMLRAGPGTSRDRESQTPGHRGELAIRLAVPTRGFGLGRAAPHELRW